MGQSPISTDPNVMHGMPCFTGTRVPVTNLFDLLAHGRTIEYFLEQWNGALLAAAAADGFDGLITTDRGFQ